MKTQIKLAAVLAVAAVVTGCATTNGVRSEAEAANVTVARRFVEEFLGGKNPAAFDELADPNIRAYTGLKPDGPIEGAAQYKQIFAGFSAAFPEMSMQIDDIFTASGDRVVVRFTAVGTHKGEMFGIKPTNRPITFNETHVMTLRNGRIVENRVSANNFEFELLMAPVLIPMVMPWLAPAK